MSVIETLLKSGAVAIVRTADQASCQEAADAIVGAGLTSIEITLTRSKVAHDINLCALDTNSYYPISPDYLINNSFIEK